VASCPHCCPHASAQPHQLSPPLALGADTCSAGQRQPPRALGGEVAAPAAELEGVEAVLWGGGREGCVCVCVCVCVCCESEWKQLCAGLGCSVCTQGTPPPATEKTSQLMAWVHLPHPPASQWSCKPSILRTVISFFAWVEIVPCTGAWFQGRASVLIACVGQAAQETNSRQARVYTSRIITRCTSHAVEQPS
jgi:hypothetical protein